MNFKFPKEKRSRFKFEHKIYFINLDENIERWNNFSPKLKSMITRFPAVNGKILDKNNIWVPDGEDHNGLCDRFAILSRENIIPYINILESFFLKSNKFYYNISREKDWNMERILKMNLKENNILHLVKRIPYVMYAVRNVQGATRWSTGVFNKKLGYFIKYPPEFDSANKHYYNFSIYNNSIDNYYKAVIRCRWE